MASPPALRLRYRLRVAERAPDSRDQRKKTFPKDACGQKIWAGGNRGASQSTSRVLKFLVRFTARFITYPWGSSLRSGRTASAKALKWKKA